MAKASRVFISHTADQKGVARQLASELRQAGIDTVGPLDSSTAGDALPESLEAKLRAADSIIVLVSPKWRSGNWQDAEVGAALEDVWAHPRKRLIPVVLGRSLVPPALRAWQALHWEPKSQPAPVAKLLAALQLPASQLASTRKVDQDPQRRRRLGEIRSWASSVAIDR